jgi:hypothetical protein
MRNEDASPMGDGLEPTLPLEPGDEIKASTPVNIDRSGSAKHEENVKLA